jgi:hypothetical protein
MRKLKIIEHISLDSVIQAGDSDFPYGDWTAPYRTPAGLQKVIAMYGETLLGLRKDLAQAADGEPISKGE